MKHTAESIAALPTAEILPALAAHWEALTGEGMRYWQNTDTHFEICRDLRDIAAMEAEIAQRKAEIVSNAKTLLAWTVWCGVCTAWNQVSGTKSACIKTFRKEGWGLVPGGKTWVCPSCLNNMRRSPSHNNQQGNQELAD